MVPIHHTQAVVPHAVLDEERAIIAAEGWYHVAKTYYPNAADADKMRRAEAERRVRERERAEKLACAFCFAPIGGHVAVIIAQRPVHPECAKAFDEWVDSHSEENDPRWLTVTDSTPVIYENQSTTWGELAGNEKMQCEFRADGVLVGQAPI